jgi:hypothetical protein
MMTVSLPVLVYRRQQKASVPAEKAVSVKGTASEPVLSEAEGCRKMPYLQRGFSR